MEWEVTLNAKVVGGIWASPTERCICNLGGKGGREGVREKVGEMEVMKILRREILIRSWQRRRLAAFESGCGGFGDRKRGFFHNTACDILMLPR